MVIYFVMTLLRPTENGYLYYSPAYLSVGFYISYILSLLCTIIWLFLWDKEYLWASLGIIVAASVCLYVTIGFSFHGMSSHGQHLVDNGHPREISLVISLVYNCLGLYAGWITVLALVNLAAALTYDVIIKQEVSCSISLGVLAFIFVMYICLDIILFERHFRHLFTPYIAVCFALVGILVGNWHSNNQNSIFVIALCASSALLFFVKIGRSIIKERSTPMFILEVDPK